MYVYTMHYSITTYCLYSGIVPATHALCGSIKAPCLWNVTHNYTVEHSHLELELCTPTYTTVLTVCVVQQYILYRRRCSR